MRAADRSSRRPVALGAVLAVIGLAVIALAGLTAMYTGATRGVGADSDTASLVLEGQSILQGHLLLHGWALSLDSFWTSEVPFYAVADLVAGIRPALLYVVPAFLYALVVLACAALAAEAATKRAGVVAGVVAAVALIAFPTWAQSVIVLRGGHHLGALLFALAAFWLLRRGAWGWGAAVAGVLLVAGMLGDLQAVAYGTAPVFAAGLSTMLRRRSFGAGAVQVAVAVGSVVVAVAIREAAKAVGTFSIGSANPVAKHPQMVHNLRHLYSLGGELIGWKHTVFGTAGAPTALYDLHKAGAAVIVVGSAAALFRLVRGVVAGGPAERIDDSLVAACFGSAATYVILAFADIVTLDRYLAPTAIFMSLLAARMVARLASRPRVAWRRAAVGAGAVLAACYAAAFAYEFTTAPYPQPTPALASWLEQHHLTNGVGAYWAASITTVYADGHVRVRPVIPDGGHLVRYMRESAAEWYAGQRFDFLVFAPGALATGVDAAEATATWGPPARQVAYDGYTILVWPHPFTVSPSRGSGAG